MQIHNRVVKIIAELSENPHINMEMMGMACRYHMNFKIIHGKKADRSWTIEKTMKQASSLQREVKNTDKTLI